MIELALLIALIASGFSFIWRDMIDPIHGMFPCIGRRLFGTRLSKPLGECPKCFTFWSALAGVIVASIVYGLPLIIGAAAVATAYLISIFVIK